MSVSPVPLSTDSFFFLSLLSADPHSAVSLRFHVGLRLFVSLILSSFTLRLMRNLGQLDTSNKGTRRTRTERAAFLTRGSRVGRCVGFDLYEYIEN